MVSPPASPAVPAPPADVEPESGDIPAYESVESAIRREIDGLAGIEDKAGHVAMALNLARTLDQPVAVAQHPSALAAPMESLPGAGSAPGVTMPSYGVEIDGDLLALLRLHDPPVIARSRDDRTMLDLRSVAPSYDSTIVAALLASHGAS